MIKGRKVCQRGRGEGSQGDWACEREDVLLYTVRFELSSHLTSQPEAAAQQQRMGYRGGEGSGQALRERDLI